MFKDYSLPENNELIPVASCQFSEDGGRWITVNGRHVFIKDGEDVKDVLGRLNQLDTLRVMASNKSHGHEWLNPDMVSNDLSRKATYEGKTESVPLSGLIFTQAGVNDKKVKSISSNPGFLDSTEVAGLKTSDDKYILLDGHHRVVAMEELKKKNVKMKVLSVSKKSTDFGIIAK